MRRQPPQVHNVPLSSGPVSPKKSIDTYASSVQLGPTPINDCSLSSNAYLYLPWMFKVLQRLEQNVFIKEPKAESSVTRGYVYKQL